MPEDQQFSSPEAYFRERAVKQEADGIRDFYRQAMMRYVGRNLVESRDEIERTMLSTLRQTFPSESFDIQAQWLHDEITIAVRKKMISVSFTVNIDE